MSNMLVSCATPQGDISSCAEARAAASAKVVPWLVQTRRPAFQPRQAIVHLLHFDEEVASRISLQCRAASVEARAYPDFDTYLELGISDVPGCLLVHTRFPLAGELGFLTGSRRAETSLPIIIAAERADVRTAVVAMKAGAFDFLEQAADHVDLIDAVTAAIGIDRARREADKERADLRTRFATLTPRERQVMDRVTQGLLNKQVAGDLGISEITVKAHRGSVMRKMGARTLAGLVRMADAIAGPQELRHS